MTDLKFEEKNIGKSVTVNIKTTFGIDVYKIFSLQKNRKMSWKFVFFP